MVYQSLGCCTATLTVIPPGRSTPAGRRRGIIRTMDHQSTTGTSPSVVAFGVSVAVAGPVHDCLQMDPSDPSGERERRLDESTALPVVLGSEKAKRETSETVPSRQWRKHGVRGHVPVPANQHTRRAWCLAFFSDVVGDGTT